MPENEYDLIIVGTGPAGYTASIYASRYKVKNLLIGESAGGLIGESHKVCNYPTEDEITGLELAAKMQRHAKSAGAAEILDRVVEISSFDNGYKVTTQRNGTFWARAVLLSMGLRHRKLNVPGEKDFSRRGVAYCATCDGALFYDKTVAVVGGGDSAISSAVYLSDIAKKVYLIYRKEKLRGEPVWADLATQRDNIEIIYNTEVKEIFGDKFVHSIEVDPSYQGRDRLDVDGVFVEIGVEPGNELIKPLGLSTDDAGYIKVGSDQSTNIPGMFAAGDITNASDQFRQVVTACSEGAIAARGVFNYLSKHSVSLDPKLRSKVVTTSK
ncbi:MAG: FAD-dependent oxidoreductase [Patescibacteria group bacterium]|jgi:thioredoxin reductase (NADPH)